MLLFGLQPSSIDQAAEAIQTVGIPLRIRYFMVTVAIGLLGIHDELIVAVGHAFSCLSWQKKAMEGSLLGSLCNMNKVFQMARARAPHPDDSEHYQFVHLFGRTLQGAEDDGMWIRWMCESPHFFALLMITSTGGIRLLCSYHKVIQPLVRRMLLDRVGCWGDKEVSKAKLLVDELGDTDPSLVAEVHRLEANHVSETACLLAEEALRREASDASSPASQPSSSVPKKKKKKKKKKKTREEEEDCESRLVSPSDLRTGDLRTGDQGEATISTHRDLVRRMSAHFDLDCELIGSGIFTDTSDADVVVTLAATDLAGAYDRVRARTGWRPLYDEVNGEQVAVLHGRFEGVDVDAQVWRGEATTTRAEAETRRALDLARRMHEHLDEAGKHSVRLLHAWAHARGPQGPPPVPPARGGGDVHGHRAWPTRGQGGGDAAARGVARRAPRRSPRGAL